MRYKKDSKPLTNNFYLAGAEITILHRILPEQIPEDTHSHLEIITKFFV